MRRLAARLRAEDRARAQALDDAERVARALALGREGLEAFRRAYVPPLPRVDAIRQVEGRRQAGRRPSPSLRALAR
jgi:hypothetical protein